MLCHHDLHSVPVHHIVCMLPCTVVHKDSCLHYFIRKGSLRSESHRPVVVHG